MNWFKKIFTSKKAVKSENKTLEDEILTKINETILSSRNEIKQADSEIDKINKWAVDAIHSTFKVPNNFWYEEINKYDEIKKLDINKELEHQLIEKCDQVINSYLSEIELRKKKILLLENLILKYKANKNKLIEIKKRKKREETLKSKLNNLESHSDKIKELRSASEENDLHFKETEKLATLQKEINEVEEDFEIQEEVRNCLLELNKEYGLNETPKDSLRAINEIDELLNKVKEF